jgi:hypothetical protein
MNLVNQGVEQQRTGRCPSERKILRYRHVSERAGHRARSERSNIIRLG